MNLKNIIISWDFLLSIIFAMIFAVFVKTDFTISESTQLFSISISVLAILFSVFLAVFVILISAGDNEFILFLEKSNSYEKIINYFKYTLIAIFIALLLSITFFIVDIQLLNKSNYYFPQSILSIYIFFVAYAFFCSISTVFDSIEYARRRATFLKSKAELDDFEGLVKMTRVSIIKKRNKKKN